VYIGKSRLSYLGAKILYGIVSLLLATKAFDKAAHTEYSKHRATIDLEVVRSREILTNNTLDNYLEGGSVDTTCPQLRSVVAIAVVVPIVLLYIVVCPHNVEIHLLVAWRLQEAIVESALQEWLAIEPIPIVDEGVDTILKCGVDPLFDNCRVIVVLIAPIWQARLIVTFETRITLFDHLPFALSVGPEIFACYCIIVARRPDVGGYDIVAFCLLLVASREGTD
jgi:hypothetical protein